jgi:hypothetical protein
MFFHHSQAFCLRAGFDGKILAAATKRHRIVNTSQSHAWLMRVNGMIAVIHVLSLPCDPPFGTKSRIPTFLAKSR